MKVKIYHNLKIHSHYPAGTETFIKVAETFPSNFGKNVQCLFSCYLEPHICPMDFLLQMLNCLGEKHILGCQDIYEPAQKIKINYCAAAKYCIQ